MKLIKIHALRLSTNKNDYQMFRYLLEEAKPNPFSILFHCGSKNMPTTIVFCDPAMKAENHEREYTASPANEFLQTILSAVPDAV